MATSGEGRMLGRYQLLYLLGQGGMGEVHLARLTGAAGFEKLCIVKTVLPSLMGDQNFIDRFHHEARVLVQLTHSNVAQVYDMGEVDGTLYMAIEYVPGVDLSRVESRVERQRAVMPIPIAIFIGQQINEALGYAHRKVGAEGTALGIVHRDVSPQNVMVSYEGEVKVIDFGLAKSAARSKHTLPSTVMGKLGYMSPEQALAKPVDHRSDIFSSGIVVWEMLAGCAMYQGGTMSEMVAQMGVADVPPLSSARPDISPTLEQIVMRALAKDPAARYQRADDFARALNELAVREQLTVGAEDVGNYVRAMCPEEFAAERQLQSKLSLLRKGIVQEVVVAQPEFEGTLVRATPAAPALHKTDSGQVMTPAQRALSMVETAPQLRAKSEVDIAMSLPKSRAPMVVASLLGFIVFVGAILFWFQSPQAEGVQRQQLPVKVEQAQKPEVVPDAEGPEIHVEKRAAKDEEPNKAPVVIDTMVTSGKVWKVLRKEGEDLMLLENKDKVFEGERIYLVGQADAKGSRPVYARGAVLSVKGSLATLIFDEAVALPEVVFAAKENARKKAPAVVPQKREETVRTVEVSKAPAPAPAPAAVTPAPKSAEPELVVEPYPSKAPAPRPTSQLFGNVRISQPNSAGDRTVFVRNQTRLPLTACELRLPSNLVYRFNTKTLGAQDEIKIGFREFRADTRPADPQFKGDWAAVYCNEGTGYWKTVYDRR